MGGLRLPVTGGHERSPIGPYVGFHIIFTPPKPLVETIPHPSALVISEPRRGRCRA